MKAIRKIADKHKLCVIEDNAQASARAATAFKIGELSDAVCTSFIIQKNLGTFGDGGAVVTNRPDIDRTVRKLRNHGSDKRTVPQLWASTAAWTTCTPASSAPSSKHIDAWNDLRRKWAARYTAGLKGARNFTLPYETARLSARVPPLRHRDEETRAARSASGFPESRTASTPRPTTRSPSTSRTAIRGAKTRASSAPLPNAERNAATCVSLPMFPELTAEEVDYVIAKTLEWDQVTA